MDYSGWESIAEVFNLKPGCILVGDEEVGIPIQATLLPDKQFVVRLPVQLHGLVGEMQGWLYFPVSLVDIHYLTAVESRVRTAHHCAMGTPWKGGESGTDVVNTLLLKGQSKGEIIYKQ